MGRYRPTVELRPIEIGSPTTREAKALAWVRTTTLHLILLLYLMKLILQVAAYLLAPCRGGRASFRLLQMMLVLTSPHIFRI